MADVGKWDQVLAFGQYQHATIDGEPVLTVFDASTCTAMLDDFAAHPESDIFYDKQHEIVESLGDDAMDRESLKKWGDGHAMAWANALCMVVGGQVVRYEAHPGAPAQPPRPEDLRQSDGADRGDGVYAYRCDVTPRGADPKEGLTSFRYTSPYFVPERDGWRLLNLTATNDPRMRGVALAMNRDGQRVSMEKQDPSGEGDPNDFDTDDDGEVDVEHYPLPAGLLRDAGIESDEDWEETGAMNRLSMNSSFKEEDHPRAEDGKFGSKGGSSSSSSSSPAPAPKAPKAPKGTWGKASTTPVPKKEGGKPGGGAGAQLPPELQTRLKDLGINKLPAAHISDVHVSDAIHDDTTAHQGALLRWKDDKGKEQRAYSSEFDRKNAEKKWERVLTNRPKVDAQMDELRSKAGDSPAHAAALLIALTGLRPGSSTSVKDTGHFGATTMQAQHVTFDDDGAHIQYVGKAGKVNKAHVTDPSLVGALKKATEGKDPTAPVFKGVSSAKVAEALPKGVKTKDLRTLVATTDAERHLASVEPPPLKKTGDPKKDAAAEKAQARAVVSILKAVSTQVSKQLNNTPAMARRSYIAPQVIRAWGEKHGLKPEWLGDAPQATQRINMEKNGADPAKEVTMNDEEKKELMARAGCMADMSPAAQIEKMAAYIRKMEDEGKKKDEDAEIVMDAMRSVKMDVDPSNWAQNAAVHIKTGNSHDGKGDTPIKSKYLERMEDGDKPEAKSEAMQAMQRQVSVQEEKIRLLESTLKTQRLEHEALARQAKERAQREESVAAETWADEALRNGMWNPIHAGGQTVNDPVKAVAMTRDWLKAKYLKGEKDILCAPGTFKPSESQVMQRYTEGGRAIGAPDPMTDGLAESLDTKLDRHIGAELKAAKEANRQMTTAQAMERVRVKHPDLYRSWAATSGRLA